ncbi:MAG: DegQ family serine endoprotease [Deltaproteobacteria bacterium]|nr:DegQ family serine endoprotease [Deltaproteobacteria bacterium]
MSFPSGAFGGEYDKEIEAMMRTSKARAAIVREISASVVNISVEKNVKTQGTALPEPFQDEFFRRFFQPRMNPREFKQQGLGSGVIVDASGIILTNNHVAGDADVIKVKLKDGREFKATLIGTDPSTDVAVIRIKGTNLPSAKLGSSDEIEVGESVIAIGNPFGLEQTITAGIVSAKGRSGVGVTDYEDFIQTDASINPGNSGGPLVNLRGEVVGINTAIFSRSGGSQGIGFAIPIKMASSVMKSLMETGSVARGFLGVVIQDISPDLAEALGVNPHSGVLIAQVGPDSPAKKSGIQDGDIITAFNSKPVTNSNGLRYAVAELKPGSKVPVELIREGKTMTLMALVGNQPGKEVVKAPNGNNEKTTGILGMTVAPLDQVQAKNLGYSGLNGLLVTQVAPGGPAFEVGIRQGVLIMEVNRKPIRSVSDFKREVKKTPKGKKILLLAREGENSRFLVIAKP